jgi:predicted AAA+ superfamily ATPase
MYSRLLVPPAQHSFFLFGPRGTGKTTWVKNNFPNHLYIDLLNGKTFNNLIPNTSRMEEMIPKNFSDWIVIDEIQRIPGVLNEVHRLIESNHHKFILTGSSARKLRRGGVNLLAGRAFIFNMHPLTAFELGDDFNLEEAAKFGLMPSVVNQTDKEDYLESYVSAYLQQEIDQEGITRNLPAFARFLETASFSQGSVLNMSEVAREASVGRRMVEDYFYALEDLLVGVRIPVFTKKAKRKLVSHNKFYFFDAGIYRTVRPISPFDDPQMVGGIALETLVLQNLRAINDYLKLRYQIYYFRTVAGVEVDFILYGERGLIAIEVKSKRDIFESDLTGLKTFLEDYPITKCYVFYGGKQKMYFDNIEAWPVRDALLHLPEILSKTNN